MTVDLRSKFEELEARRKFHVEGLDAAVGGQELLRTLDRHLLELGLHEELQLENTYHVRIEPADEALYEPDSGFVPSSEGGKPEVSEEPTPPSRQPDTEKTAKSNGRRYSGEEKAEAVRLAEELGADLKAENQLGVGHGNVRRWRDAGFGRKPKSQIARPGPQAPEPPASGPSVRCPTCHAHLPLSGAPDETWARGEAFTQHYKTFPACEASNRRRGR
jgi:hypothetical protein